MCGPPALGKSLRPDQQVEATLSGSSIWNFLIHCPGRSLAHLVKTKTSSREAAVVRWYQEVPIHQ